MDRNGRVRCLCLFGFVERIPGLLLSLHTRAKLRALHQRTNPDGRIWAHASDWTGSDGDRYVLRWPWGTAN